jgi:ribosomal protein S18 acetylase RimI-like enzyme
MKIDVVRVDYQNERHAKDLAYLLNDYAEDVMGGGVPLAASVRQNIATVLSRVPQAFSLLAYVDDIPAGLVNCFEGFSTFKCQPLINVHDIAVVSDFRGLGLSQRMLDQVEVIAIEKGCCKITLEVLEGNKVAQQAYLKFGFDGYQLDPALGKALFWKKHIGDN